MKQLQEEKKSTKGKTEATLKREALAKIMTRRLEADWQRELRDFKPKLCESVCLYNVVWDPTLTEIKYSINKLNDKSLTAI